MKVLVITQAVDLDAPVLAFFHAWLARMAGRLERVTAIGLRVGRHDLPSNARVFSLGKENRVPRPLQVFRFWKLIWSLRKDYDVAFVHMTPIWVVLGAPLWLARGVPVVLWYEGRRGGWLLRLALSCVRTVLSASPSGLPWSHPKQVVIGHGIDADAFAPRGARDPFSVVTVGRVTPVKHHDRIIAAFAGLPASYALRIVGACVTKDDASERARLDDLARSLGVEDRVTIEPAPYAEIPSILSRASLFLHAATGGLDKALLEAMASGCLAVTTAPAAEGILPERCVATPETFGEKVAAVAALDPEGQEKLRASLRAIVAERHGLDRCIARLCDELSRAAGR